MMGKNGSKSIEMESQYYYKINIEKRKNKILDWLIIASAYIKYFEIIS